MIVVVCSLNCISLLFTSLELLVFSAICELQGLVFECTWQQSEDDN